jgi:hypothetical protein
MAWPDQQARADHPAGGASEKYESETKGPGREYRTSEYWIKSRAGECEPLRDDSHAEQERDGAGMTQQPNPRLDR